jgi:hypothetical protein
LHLSMQSDLSPQAGRGTPSKPLDMGSHALSNRVYQVG